MASEHESAVDRSGPTIQGAVAPSRLVQFEQATVAWIISAVLGFALIFNQAGEGLARVVRDFADITWLSAFWLVNMPVATSGGRWFLGACVLLICAAYYLLWRKHPATHIRAAFYLGFWSGLLVLPILLLTIVFAILVVVVIGYVLYWVATAMLWLLSVLFAYVIGPVLAFVAIPFIWLWENALRPFLNFLAIPFVWIWATILAPVFSVIAIPFVWLWTNALLPLLTFLVTVILKWIVIAFVAVAATIVFVLLTFSMFGAVWRVFEESFRNAAQGEFTEQTAFACGIGTGLFLFDLSLAYVLHLTTGLVFFPAISHFVLLLVPTVFLLRLAFSRAYEFAYEHRTPYIDCCKRYWATSRLELYVTAAAIPILLAIAVLSNSEGGDA